MKYLILLPLALDCLLNMLLAGVIRERRHGSAWRAWRAAP